MIVTVNKANDLSRRNGQNIGTIIDELNRRDTVIADATARVSLSGSITFRQIDFTQTTVSPPYFDWSGSKTVSHNLGYTPLIIATMLPVNIAEEGFGATNGFVLPQTPFEVFNDSDPAFYQRKPATAFYFTVDTSSVTFWGKGAFFNPIAVSYPSGIIIYYYVLDQALGL